MQPRPPIQPWSIMGYYPPVAASHAEETFFEHFPHFLMFMCVIFVTTACGWAIADVFELRSSNKYLILAASSLMGIALASRIFLGYA
jgi:hypothetical protein